MKAIYKYEVEFGPIHEIELPVGANITCVDYQGDKVFFWAEVDLSKSTEKRRFCIFPTGAEVGDFFRHIGTAHMRPYVWHVYEYLPA